jgi:hypothetical protein
VLWFFRKVTRLNKCLSCHMSDDYLVTLAQTHSIGFTHRSIIKTTFLLYWAAGGAIAVG